MKPTHLKFKACESHSKTSIPTPPTSMTWPVEFLVTISSGGS